MGGYGGAGANGLNGTKVEPVVMEEEVGRVVIMLKIAAAMGAMAVTVAMAAMGAMAAMVVMVGWEEME